jgi:hypothetical protein
MAAQFSISRQGYYKLLKRNHGASKEDVIVKQKVMQIRQRMPRPGGRKLHYMLNPIFRKEVLKYGRDKFYDLLRK